MMHTPDKFVDVMKGKSTLEMGVTWYNYCTKDKPPFPGSIVRSNKDHLYCADIRNTRLYCCIFEYQYTHGILTSVYKSRAT